MLQNDAVRNLHYDNDIRAAQQQPQNHINPIVYEGPISITSQPSPVRAAPPIPTVEQVVANRRLSVLPKTGFEFLTDLPSIHIEQTYELNDSLTGISSENRFVIRSPLGESLFAATESSTERNRLIWGNSRPFQMHILDKTNQEVFVFRKKLSLGAFCCSPQTLEIWKAPGNYLGRIVQSPTLTVPTFYAEDADTNRPLLCLEATTHSGCYCFCLPKECFFKIHSGGDLRASIDHKWLANKSMFTTNIYFKDAKLTAKERALIMASAFLLEYLYFQKRF